MGESDTLLNAGIGALVTIVTSFLPFSPILGGAVAGYLQAGDRREGAKVGGLSGALSLLPMLFFGFIVLVFLTGVGPTEGAVAFTFLFFVVGTLVFAYTIGLGALGWYIGVYVLEETEVGRSVDRPGGRDEITSEFSEDRSGSADGDDEPTARDSTSGWDDREDRWGHADEDDGDDRQDSGY